MDLKKQIATTLERFAPALYRKLRADQTRGAIYRRMRQTERLTQKLLPVVGKQVRRGPFKGMEHPQRESGGALAPKLLGSYECELHGILNELNARRIERIVNIGCGEGYYAVGLARNHPESRVIAYDINPAARKLCKTFAELNHVAPRVDIRAACDWVQLKNLTQPGMLLLLDCEGFEFELLDRSDAPEHLREVLMLIEVHDFVEAGGSDCLRERFAQTHSIRTIWPEPRDPDEWIEDEDPLDIRIAMGQLLDEMRPKDNFWLFLEPKEKTGS